MEARRLKVERIDIYITMTMKEQKRFVCKHQRSMTEFSNLQKIYVEETDRISVRNLYKISYVDDHICLKPVKKSDRRWQSLFGFITDIFLPYGYPNSVSEDYLRYQFWDSIQAFASSITGNICTHAVLKGAGVGDQNASVLAATITWLIKDGTSMVGRITFAWLQGTKLDSDCKKWRLFADVMNDAALFLDLVSAYFQNYFTLIVSLSGLIKSLVGVAGGSTRAALTQHQARNNNMADVSAKDGSQETLVNLVALICSFVFIPIVTQSFLLTWLTYISMTMLHLIANYFAVKSVTMETFNFARFKIYVQHYFSQGGNLQSLLSINEVNKKESVFFSMYSKETIINLGSPMKDIIDGKRPKELEMMLQFYRECGYILSCNSKSNASKVVINIALSYKASALTEIEAMYEACYLDYMLHNGSSCLDNILCYVTAARDYTRKTFSNFLKFTKEKGFNVHAVYFNSNKWRIDL